MKDKPQRLDKFGQFSLLPGLGCAGTGRSRGKTDEENHQILRAIVVLVVDFPFGGSNRKPMMIGILALFGQRLVE